MGIAGNSAKITIHLLYLLIVRCHSFFSLVVFTILSPLALCRADATKPPANGQLFDLQSADALSTLKNDDGVTTSIAEAKDGKMIKIDFAKLSGYPGINFPIPEGGWDLTGSTGIQIEISNPGTIPVVANLKANNPDGSGDSSNTEIVTVGPGETHTLKLVFGISYNHPGYKLDPAHVTALKFFIIPPKSPTSLLVGNPKVFTGGSTASEVTSFTPVPSPPLTMTPPPPPPPAPPVFPSTPLLDITGKHDFPDASTVSDDAATQLKGLCTLAEFQAIPEIDRHVYSFDVWPGDKDSLEAKSYAFNFHLGAEGVTAQKVAFIPDGGGAGSTHILMRSTDAASKKSVLTGFGNLDWSGKQTHVFKFNKPVLAFGVVLHSTGDFSLRKFFWQAAHDLNGYPVSYTLADGTIIQLGERELAGATLKGDTNAFIGVIDRTGRGITSVTYTLTGLAGNKAQGISMVDLAFATLPRPTVSPIINLKSSCDFENPEDIKETPTPALSGLLTLDDFRFIVANHRYVYNFATWPQDKPDLGSNTVTLSFDLKGKGNADEKVTVTATNEGKDAKLTQVTLKSEDGQPYKVLGGLGNLSKGKWAQQTFKFEKPVWAVGVAYSSPGELNLAKPDGAAQTYPVSYTLSDGTVVNLGAAGAVSGTIAANEKTFVGVKDTSDKGISSITFRVEGAGDSPQPLYIDDLAFALAGPPPGDFKLTMHDEFDGDKLDPKYWATGYTFPDVINNELQAYVPENVVVGNGLATIKIEYKNGVNTDRTGRQKGGAQKFTSGAFTSYDKWTQTYGYFEARLKMTKAPGAGLWPAFWVLPDRGPEFGKVRGSYRTKDYGMGSEIDIFEFMPRWKGLDGLFPIHCGTIWSYGKVTPTDPEPHGYGAYALGNDGWGPAEMHFPNLDTEFHTYGLYWSKERLIFYVDSKPIFRVRDAKNVPDVPEYFLFNVAMSGNGWGKSPDKSNPKLSNIAGDLPNEMQIDYFRAYSGILDEAVPTSPSDMPVIHKYDPPPPEAPAPAVAAPAPATPAPAPAAVPAAPVNSTINTPSQ